MNPFPRRLTARSDSAASPVSLLRLLPAADKAEVVWMAIRNARHYRDGDRRTMAARAGEKCLPYDLNTDVHQDWRDRRRRNPIHQQWEISDDAAHTDEQSRSHSVPGAGSHRFVRWVTDVGCAFDHSSAKPCR